MTRLTAKPHAFAGAILSPKHARDLNPTLCMAITSSLAEQQNHSNHHSNSSSTTPTSTSTGSYAATAAANSKISDSVPYTLWITEAWRVLGWAEPSAALFWEMATLFAALQAAGRECYNADSYYYQYRHPHQQQSAGGSYHSASQHTSSHGLQQQQQQQQQQNQFYSRTIPPILSCGSTGSMTSGATSSHAAVMAEKQKKFSSAVSAKELPVWLVGTFLLLHCEEFACQRSLSGEDERRFVYNNNNNAAASAVGTELHQSATANTMGGGRMDFNSLFRHQSLSPRCVFGLVTFGLPRLDYCVNSYGLITYFYPSIWLAERDCTRVGTVATRTARPTYSDTCAKSWSCRPFPTIRMHSWRACTWRLYQHPPIIRLCSRRPKHRAVAATLPVSLPLGVVVSLGRASKIASTTRPMTFVDSMTMSTKVWDCRFDLPWKIWSASI